MWTNLSKSEFCAARMSASIIGKESFQLTQIKFHKISVLLLKICYMKQVYFPT